MGVLECVCAFLFCGDPQEVKAQAGSRLEGTWEVVAVGGPKGPQLWRKPSQGWTFTKDRATFHSGEAIGIPLDGSTFDLRIDESKSPKRFKLSSHDGESEEVFAYCIFDQHKDTLIVRMLFPLALGSADASEEAVKAFRKSPYPSDFSVRKHDGTAVFILQRVKDPPVPPKRGQTGPG